MTDMVLSAEQLVKINAATPHPPLRGTLSSRRGLCAGIYVLVNDPTMGYGIYIGNMLDAAA